MQTRSAPQTTALVRQTGRPPTPLNVLDHALCIALSNPSFYRRGWGDMGVVDRVLEVAALMPDPVAPRVQWLDLPKTHRGITRMAGCFESPANAYIPLPYEARTGFFELLLPEGASPAVRPPVCVYLAATAEQGYMFRRNFTAPLVRRGIGSLILENPYYGRRRPARQRLAALESVADQLMMNASTVIEARALLHWLRESGFAHVGLSGFSMGGFMAAYTASFVDYPIAVVPCLAGASASMAFTAFPFAHFPAWSRLGHGPGAREALGELFEVFSLERYSPPVDTDLVQVVAARSDSVVVPENVRKLAAHWDVPIRWVPGGHFSSVVRGRNGIHDALLDAFGMLMVRETQRAA